MVLFLDLSVTTIIQHEQIFFYTASFGGLKGTISK